MSLLPSSCIMRGEALFWMEKFRDAEKYISFGMALLLRDPELSDKERQLRSWAATRLGDIALIRHERAQDKKNRSKSDLSRLKQIVKNRYFRVSHEFPDTEAGKIATLRRICIGVEDHEGNNLRHAQKKLEEIRSTSHTSEIIELSWSCQLKSLARQEKSEGFIDAIKPFLEKFPFSKLLHAPGVFFSPTRNQIDNPREVRYVPGVSKPIETGE